MLHYIRTLFFLQLRGLSPPVSVSFTSALTPHGADLAKEQKEVNHTAMNISSVFGLPFWPKIHCFMFNTCCITPQLLDHNPCPSNRRRGKPSPIQQRQHDVCVCVYHHMRFSVAWCSCSTCLLCFYVCTFQCEYNYEELEVMARLKRAQLAHTCTLLSPLAGLDDEVVEWESEEIKCKG